MTDARRFLNLINHPNKASACISFGPAAPLPHHLSLMSYPGDDEGRYLDMYCQPPTCVGPERSGKEEEGKGLQNAQPDDYSYFVQ